METNKSREDLEREVRYVLSLHKGEANAISRWALVERVFGREAALNRSNNNPFDRQIREVIEKFRDIDLICSTSSASGYWIAADMKDVLKVAEEFEKRSLKMLAKKNKLIERGKEKFGGQLELI